MPGEVEKMINSSVDSNISPLEKKAHFEKEIDEVEEVIKEIVSEIIPDENYKKIEIIK